MLALLLLAATPAVEWRPIAPGVEYANFELEPKPSSGDGRLHVVRIDAKQAALDVGLASEHGGTLRTAREWCEDKGFVVAINAGMYDTDYSSNVGYLRHGDTSHRKTWNASYQSALVAQPKEKGLAAVQLLDLDEENAKMLAGKYALVIQNLRLVKGRGESVWKPNGQRWSEAAVGVDDKNRVLFMFSRTPLEMAKWNERVLALPLALQRAMHVEGGPEASLSISTKDFSLHLGGGPRNSLFAGDPTKQWRIPNVLGVRAK